MTFEEIKSKWLKIAKEKVEQRPCNSLERKDGNFNYMHQKDVMDLIIAMYKDLARAQKAVKTLEHIRYVINSIISDSTVSKCIKQIIKDYDEDTNGRVAEDRRYFNKITINIPSGMEKKLKNEGVYFRFP